MPSPTKNHNDDNDTEPRNIDFALQGLKRPLNFRFSELSRLKTFTHLTFKAICLVKQIAENILQGKAV